MFAGWNHHEIMQENCFLCFAVRWLCFTTERITKLLLAWALGTGWRLGPERETHHSCPYKTMVTWSGGVGVWRRWGQREAEGFPRDLADNLVTPGVLAGALGFCLLTTPSRTSLSPSSVIRTGEARWGCLVAAGQRGCGEHQRSPRKGSQGRDGD